MTNDRQLPLRLPPEFRPDTTAEFYHGGAQWRAGARTFYMAHGWWGVQSPSACRAALPTGEYIVQQREVEGQWALSAFPADTVWRPSLLLGGRATTQAELAVLWTILRSLPPGSSPQESRTAPVPERDSWGDCVAAAPDLPADSTRILVDLPTDTSRAALSGYAEHQSWFRNDPEVELSGREYAKFGRIHRFNPAGLRAQGLDLRRVGEYKGIPLYQIVPGPERPDVLFVPLRPGCFFYPYQWRTDQNMRYHG